MRGRVLAGAYVSILLALTSRGLDAQGRALVRGRVLTDSTELPIAGAAISIPRVHATALSDSLGRFALAGIEPGEHLVIVRRIGFAPASSVIRFAAGDSVDADFLLMPAVQQLSNVDVRGKRVSAKLAEFEERRALGIGHFLTEEEITRRGSTKVSDVVRVLPGLLVVRLNGNGDVYIASSRGAQSLRRAGGSRPCPAEIVLDGIPLSGTDVDNIVQPSDIAAIEWYAGAAQTPTKYNRTKNMCSVLVIWTK
jgi:hypothetical protein